MNPNPHVFTIDSDADARFGSDLRHVCLPPQNTSKFIVALPRHYIIILDLYGFLHLPKPLGVKWHKVFPNRFIRSRDIPNQISDIYNTNHVYKYMPYIRGLDIYRR